MRCAECDETTDVEDICRLCHCCEDCCECMGEPFTSAEMGEEPEDEWERRTR